MKVLMFGWEFPPLSSGGLGTACYGLTKSLAKKGVEITFVLPSASEINDADFLRFRSANEIINLKIKKIESSLRPYMTSEGYSDYMSRKTGRLAKIYGSTLFDEVYRYTLAAEKIAEEENFDVIHCHDWMTFGAGIRAKRMKNRPLVLHVHSTEHDRTGGHVVNQYVYGLERAGMHKADKVIAVSHFTKDKIKNHYSVPSNKIAVVHNAVDFSQHYYEEEAHLKGNDKLVLFLGRLTLQKGPDYFVHAAKKILEHEKNVKFMIAGTGDMEPFVIEKAAELGISNKMLFAGFLNPEEVERAYKMADIYVMPSVSEPFGITALEAMKNRTAAVVSKQSGVSEVINHCLKVDFWDVNELSNKVISTLRYKALQDTLKDNGYFEVKKFSWDIPAQKCIDVYNDLLRN